MQPDDEADSDRFLRKRLIGKTVHVLIDYVKPKDGEFEERECVTITYGNSNKLVPPIYQLNESLLILQQHF